jgi:DNA-binding CsgD family transcriptional regulator
VPESSTKTGLNILTNLVWGTHFCVFHETKQDLFDILIPYFKAGLTNNEFCFWVLTEPLTVEEALDALRSRIPDFDHYLAQGSMELVNRDELFFQAGKLLNLQTIIGRFKDKCRRALSGGYVGTRIGGSPAWLLMKDPQRFRKFERQVEQLVAGERVIALCSFPTRGSTAEDILTAARVHQFTMERRRGAWEIIEAPRAQTEIRPLTPREREVLAWLLRGKSASEIGEILHIATRTVEKHAENLVQKLGAANRTHAVAIAVRDRLVDVDNRNDQTPS